MLWLLLLGFWLSAATPAHAVAENEGSKLDFDPEMMQRIRTVEQRNDRVIIGVDESPAPQTEGDRVREGQAAIDAVLTGKPARDLDAEYKAVLDSEVRALGKDAEALDPAEEVGRLLEEPFPEPPPAPFKVVHQVRAGYEDSSFRSLAATPLTTTIVYGEYRLLYDDQPNVKTNVKVDGALFGSNIRKSGLTFFNVDHRFDEKHTAVITGTAIIERWTEDLLINDNLLASGVGTYVLHFPEELDLTGRYSYERKTFDFESIDTLSSRDAIGELRLEKRMQGGTARFVYLEDRLVFPSERRSNLFRSIFIGGYTAPVHPKVDLDYSYVRLNEGTKIDDAFTGDYFSETHRANFYVKFSNSMSLSLDVEDEVKRYDTPDTTFLSYERRLYAPTVLVNQTEHLSYNVGFLEEIYHHRGLPSAFDFDASSNDFHNQRMRLGITYAKKRLFATGQVDIGPTEYRLPSEVQSDFFTRDTFVSVNYDLDDETRVSTSYARTSQVFELATLNNSLSESVIAEVTKRF